MRAPSIHLGVRAETEGVIRRHAVKAVTEVDGRLLMLRSTTGGDYKFPGGGAEAHEDDAATLTRELDEECGRDVVRLGPLVLRVLEAHPAREDPRRRRPRAAGAPVPGAGARSGVTRDRTVAR